MEEDTMWRRDMDGDPQVANIQQDPPVVEYEWCVKEIVGGERDQLLKIFLPQMRNEHE